MSNAVSVECYSDEPKALGPLIDREAQDAGTAFAPDARAALLAVLGADRQFSRGDIAKLLLFAQGRRRIETEDVEAVLAGAAPSRLDDIIDQSLVGDLRGATVSAGRFFNEGGDGDNLINRLSARLTLLHRIRVAMELGRTFDAACQAQFIKLPIAARHSLAQQAECWMSEAITQRLVAVRGASAKVRTETRLGRILAARILWALASRSPVRKS
jgi:DNA polymerase III subunit delta